MFFEPVIFDTSKSNDLQFLDNTNNNSPNSITMSSSTTSTSSVSISPMLVKPVAALGVGTLMHKQFIAPEGSDWMNSGKFGLALSAGIFISSAFIEPYVTSGFPDSSLYSGATLADRILEVSISSAAALSAVKASGSDVVNANYGITTDTGKALLVVVGTSFISTYIADYFDNQPLSYLGSQGMPAPAW